MTTPAASGLFTFHAVAPGLHRLEIESHKLVYPHYVVEVSESGRTKVKEFHYPGAPPIALQSDVIQIKAVAPVTYYRAAASFNLASLLMNPTVIILLVMVAAMVFLPSMMENMDPAQKEDMRRQHEAMSNPAALLSGGGAPQDMGSLMSMLTGETPAPGSAQADSGPPVDPYEHAASKVGGGSGRSTRRAPQAAPGVGRKGKSKRR